MKYYKIILNKKIKDFYYKPIVYPKGKLICIVNEKTLQHIKKDNLITIECLGFNNYSTCSLNDVTITELTDKETLEYLKLKDNNI